MTNRKQTWQWKFNIFYRRYIFKWLFCHCHVSFGGCALSPISMVQWNYFKWKEINNWRYTHFPLNHACGRKTYQNTGKQPFPSYKIRMDYLPIEFPGFFLHAPKYITVFFCETDQSRWNPTKTPGVFSWPARYRKQKDNSFQVKRNSFSQRTWMNLLDFLDAWKKFQKLIPNGGLMVIYHGTIRKESPTGVPKHPFIHPPEKNSLLQTGPYDRYKCGVIAPLQMALNKWVTLTPE